MLHKKTKTLRSPVVRFIKYLCIVAFVILIPPFSFPSEVLSVSGCDVVSVRISLNASLSTSSNAVMDVVMTDTATCLNWTITLTLKSGGTTIKTQSYAWPTRDTTQTTQISISRAQWLAVGGGSPIPVYLETSTVHSGTATSNKITFGLDSLPVTLILSASTANCNNLLTCFDLAPYDPSSCDTIECFIVKIAKYLFYAAIPLFVIMVLYAGMRFLTARGEPGKIATAKNILWYAIVGLTIVLIGVGFVSLIESVIGFPSTT